MLRHPGLKLCLITAIVVSCCTPSFAAKRESRIPLRGCSGCYAAWGEAKSIEVRSGTKQIEREELIVDLQNVPMVPGTVLVVFLGDEELGSIVLDAKRNGTLKLSSETRKYVPRIEAGSDLQVKTLKGRTIIK